MGLFNKKTIESDLADANAALTESNQKLTAAETHILELEESNKALETERDAAKLEAQTANEGREASTAAYQKLEATAKVNAATVTILAAWFGEGEINAENLDTKLTEKAHAKALEIAAGQGVPPVHTDPSGTASASDEIKGEYEAAAAIADPRQRAQAFAAITAKLNAGKK